MNAKPKAISDSLLPLFANNFYENILSQKFIQNNLLYIITLLLNHEVKNGCDFNYPRKFLNADSPCGYLLYELRNKRDFQIFLKEILEEAIEIVDYYDYDICFELDKIELNLIKQNECNNEFIKIDIKGKPLENEELNETRGLDSSTIENIKEHYFSANKNKKNFLEINQDIKKYYYKT